MKLELKLSELLESIEDDFELRGDPNTVIRGFANLADAKAGDLSFVQSRKYAEAAGKSLASVMLIPSGEALTLPHGVVTVEVKHPSKVLSQICGQVESRLFPIVFTGIHPSALIGESGLLGDQVSIGAYSTVGKGSQVGERCHIGARVSIGDHCHIGKEVRIADNCVIGAHTHIGDGCKIHSGVVIGAPGFGYEFDCNTGTHQPIPQVGRVVIGKYVDIGANTTIDRARLGETVIGDGTKIDNLVQIAHNVKIGRHCILCAFVGVSGSVTMGDYVVLAGRVGVADHLEIAPGVQVGGGSGVTSSLLTPKMKAWGMPATDFGSAMKIAALQRKLPEFFKRLGQIEKQLELPKQT